MKVLVGLVLYSVSTVLLASGVNDNSNDRREAKRIVERAYTAAKKFCTNYPSSEHTVMVRIDTSDPKSEVAITVKCGTVNAYFDGELSSK